MKIEQLTIGIYTRENHDYKKLIEVTYDGDVHLDQSIFTIEDFAADDWVEFNANHKIQNLAHDLIRLSGFDANNDEEYNIAIKILDILQKESIN